MTSIHQQIHEQRWQPAIRNDSKQGWVKAEWRHHHDREQDISITRARHNNNRARGNGMVLEYAMITTGIGIIQQSYITQSYWYLRNVGIASGIVWDKIWIISHDIIYYLSLLAIITSEWAKINQSLGEYHIMHASCNVLCTVCIYNTGSVHLCRYGQSTGQLQRIHCIDT